MPQILSIHTNESYQTPVLENFSRAIRDTLDAEKLRRLHREVSAELEFRSSHPGNRCNPNLRDATDGRLFRILDEILDKVMLILSSVRASRDEIRYVNRYLDAGPENLSRYLQ